MAIAVDASSPALVGGSAASLQTAAFSPPAGSILVACMHADPGRTFTVTNTVASVTWVSILQEFPSGVGSVAARYAYLAAGATNMSVTAAGSINNDFGLKVYVVTGADTATPIGAVATGGGTADTANTLSKNLTPQVAASLGFVVAEDFTDQVGTTSSNTTFSAYDVFQNVAGGSGYRLMGAAGGVENFSVDAAGTAASTWAWGLFEVRAAPGGTTPTNTVSAHGTARQRASLW